MGLSLSIRSGRLLFSVCKALFQGFLFSAPVEELTGKALSLSLSPPGLFLEVLIPHYLCKNLNYMYLCKLKLQRH